MDREARIEALVKVPPRIELTPWQKFERVLTWITTIVATIAFILAIRSLDNTAREAKNSKVTADCVNAALLARSEIAQAQNKAARAYARSALAWENEVNTLLLHPAKSPAEKLAALKAFTRVENELTNATMLWFNKLDNLVKVSNKIPLGKC